MKRAVILLSGGIDSATCLAIAKDQGFACYALSVNYEQRHSSELEFAKRLARRFEIIEHKIININMSEIGGSALTDPEIEVPEHEASGIPVTYVPARNTIFLSLALGVAEVIKANDIFIGVNAVDYSGYPDCRPEFISAFSKMGNLAIKSQVKGKKINVNTPLIDMTKAKIIKTGVDLGVDYSLTVSCYKADKNGYACGTCDSCRIRAKGFVDAKVIDPTNYLT